MALTVQRDLENVVDGFVRWLAERRSVGVTVDRVDRPTDGWSSETVLVRARVASRHEAFAVRLPPVGEGIFPTYDLGLQARAQSAVAAGGIPVAVPAEVVDDPAWLGDPFLVMPLVEGHVPGELAAFDPWVQGLPAERQRGLHEGVVDTLVALHRLDPATAGGLPHRRAGDELAWWSRYLGWSGVDEVEAIATALAWCVEHRPGDETPSAILWGDVRLGNVVFADDGAVAALLDWEMATVGVPEHDLAWWWALEAMQDDLVGGRPAGLAPIADLRQRYEAGIGRPLQDLGWYEAFALVRSAAVLTRIGILQQRAGLDPRMPLHDNPVLDHLDRRIEEKA